jgi:hypothetical protein
LATVAGSPGASLRRLQADSVKAATAAMAIIFGNSFSELI